MEGAFNKKQPQQPAFIEKHIKNDLVINEGTTHALPTKACCCLKFNVEKQPQQSAFIEEQVKNDLVINEGTTHALPIKESCCLNFNMEQQLQRPEFIEEHIMNHADINGRRNCYGGQFCYAHAQNLLRFNEETTPGPLYNFEEANFGGCSQAHMGGRSWVEDSFGTGTDLDVQEHFGVRMEDNVDAAYTVQDGAAIERVEESPPAGVYPTISEDIRGGQLLESDSMLGRGGDSCSGQRMVYLQEEVQGDGTLTLEGKGDDNP
ncbi:hypothetical protein VNO80_05805 [Phaseolus coccineus]|uniref:Uncharacterized protein n=1 Tax=Phaseolus coccineus TaxID=3886 RepID=A0AAN9NKK5_PHACN